MTFKRYRMMDLCMFTVMMCICEALIVLASGSWFPHEPYMLSLTPAITAVVLVRWGAYAAFPALAGALTLCIASGAQPVQVLIYCTGNLLCLVLLPVLKRLTWRVLHEHVLLAMAYGAAAALLMQTGRAAAAWLCGMSAYVCAGFITTDVLSLLFSVLIVWICRRLDGMLEEQKHYLTRVHEEMLRTGGIRK
ncbi:MAG: hypothetical protein IKK34_03995 [Clostridia bacterium]|nr:hypothetical protein [Clostridia bacterium]